MTGRRRGMQGCVDGPERSNGSAHDAHSLKRSNLEPAASSSAGGAYTLTSVPARRGNGIARHRALWPVISALAGPTTPSRQSAGRAASQDGLTLSQEEGQMDRCLHVTGTSLGQDAGPIREPRGASAHMMAAPGEEGSGRSNRSVHGPT